MAEKFQNKYRIPSARAQWWDYGWNAPYFITICTKNMEHFFGKIVVVSDTMQNSPTIPNKPERNNRPSTNAYLEPSAIGKIAETCWLDIPNHFPYIYLDVHVVMPNHVHGILVIDKPANVATAVAAAPVETRLIASLPPPPPLSTPSQNPSKPPGGITGNHNPMLHDNLSRVLRWYKGRTTFESRKIDPYFSWHPRFHDHIIRDHESYQNIKNYIINNPANWEKDRYHTRKTR